MRVVLRFTIYYYGFIESFSKIAVSSTSMLKTIRLPDKSIFILIRVNVNEVINNDLEPILF